MIARISSTIKTANGKILLSLLLTIVLLGINPLALRNTYLELAPFWVSFLRYLLSAILFWIIVLYKHLPIPTGRTLIGCILYGALGSGISTVLYGWGLVKTSASLASVLMATVPLITLLLSAFHKLESLTYLGILGSFITIIGTFVTVGEVDSTQTSFVHIGAILLGAFFLAQGSVIVKLFPAAHPITTNAIAVTTGTFFLGGASLMTGETRVLPSSLSTWAALAYIVLLGTVICFVLYLYVLQKWTPSITSYSFVLSPIITMIIASILAIEYMTINFFIGSLLVLLGVTVGAFLSNKKPTKEADRTTN